MMDLACCSSVIDVTGDVTCCRQYRPRHPVNAVIATCPVDDRGCKATAFVGCRTRAKAWHSVHDSILLSLQMQVSASLHGRHMSREVVWRLQVAVFTSTKLCAPVTICPMMRPLIASQSLACNIAEHMFACRAES